MKTHCITLKQSQVGAKTIRFDVSRKKCEMEMITRVSTSKIIIHDLIIYSIHVAISKIRQMIIYA